MEIDMVHAGNYVEQKWQAQKLYVLMIEIFSAMAVNWHPFSKVNYKNPTIYLDLCEGWKGKRIKEEQCSLLFQEFLRKGMDNKGYLSHQYPTIPHLFNFQKLKGIINLILYSPFYF